MPVLQSYSGFAITYEERPGSPSEKYQGQQGTASRTFDVDWIFRWDFAQTMVGYAEAVPYEIAVGPNQRKFYHIKRGLPQPYPQPLQVKAKEGDEVTWMYATDILNIEDIGPLGYDSDNNMAYRTARITVGYNSLPYRIIEDSAMPTSPPPYQGVYEAPDVDPNDDLSKLTRTRFLLRHIQPTAEYLRIPFGVFRWVYDADETSNYAPAQWPGRRTKVANGAGTIVPSSEICYTWHQIPFIPKRIREYLGCVNHEQFDIFGPETLLFLAVEVKPYRQVGGIPAYDITYKMKHFNPPPRQARSERGHHNRLLRQVPDEKDWEWRRISPTGEGSGEPLYRKANFEHLFTYDVI